MAKKVAKVKKPNLKELEALAKRVQADFENYKKRTQKEKEEFSKYANTDLILQLLPILDNFQLAITHLPKEMTDNGWVEGVRHIKGQFEQILSGEGVTEIATIGQKYDPYLHEAVGEVESNKEKGVIVEEVRKGYRLNGKIIRHARVKVSKGKDKITKGDKNE